LRIVYMGSSSFAVPALRRLAESEQDEVVLVVTQPDRVRGRGGKVLPTPVGALADEKGIPLAKPERVRGNAEFFRALKAHAPDLIVVASYGNILPKEVLELPPFGCVNIHASLLPAYRGAAPVQQAILDGVTMTGVTIMAMGEGLDDGDMIAQTSVETGDLSAGELTELLAETGARLLEETLGDIENGTAVRVPQDAALSSYARRIERDDAHINLSVSAAECVRRVRAMCPEPGAFLTQGERLVKVLKAHAADASEANGQTASSIGTVLAQTNDGIYVQTAGGVLVIDVIQVPGKKPMLAADFLRGNRLGSEPLT